MEVISWFFPPNLLFTGILHVISGPLFPKCTFFSRVGNGGGRTGLENAAAASCQIMGRIWLMYLHGISDEITLRVYVSQSEVILHKLQYRVAHQVEPNLPLTLKQKFHFGRAWPDLDRPKRNFCVDVNRRFGSS